MWRVSGTIAVPATWYVCCSGTTERTGTWGKECAHATGKEWPRKKEGAFARTKMSQTTEK